MKLPDLALFENFATVGPTGEQPANINGKAVSIECFLDVEWEADRPARVRRTSRHQGSGQYQGALEDKKMYCSRFLDLRPSELGDYDTTNLDVLLDNILAVCTAIATARRKEDWLGSLR
jgi:hypothetical protein